MKAATGPDRKIDVAMHVAITNKGLLGDYASVDEYTNAAIQLGWNTPRVTASVDAILALIERELPGYKWGIHRDNKQPDMFRGYVVASTPFRPMPIAGIAPTPALALCAAFLAAREAQ